LYLQDILTAIPWGLLLAFSIGPGFFVLLETSITKGFRAAFTFDLGIVFSDVIFILIAYLSTNQLLEQLKGQSNTFCYWRNYYVGLRINFIYSIKKKF
jgi:threonine/homoserine/homoserine lactone efflux protein